MKSSDPHTPCILIADDQADVLEALRFLTKGEGYQSEAVTSPAAALDAIESRDFDAVLMDLNYTRDTTSGQEGLDLLNRIQNLDGNLPEGGPVGVEARRQDVAKPSQLPVQQKSPMSL